MSIHPSLNSPEKDKKPRSVLKRSERLRSMMEKGKWQEGEDVYGLPKIKSLKIKIKKEKAEKAETTTTEAAAPAAADAKAPAGKAAGKAPAKESAGKGQDKK